MMASDPLSRIRPKSCLVPYRRAAHPSAPSNTKPSRMRADPMVISEPSVARK